MSPSESRDEREMDEAGPARVGYAICTTMRTGSTWLAELLASTGVLGKPAEYFSRPIQVQLGHADYPSGFPAQADFVLRNATTRNGIYGFKIYPKQLARPGARQLGWTGIFPNLRFVHLQRRDLLGQAISRIRGRQTSQWRSTLPKEGTDRYDGPAIHEAIRHTVVQDARWHLYFARTGIEPLRLHYEDILAAPQDVVDAVGALVGLETRATVAPQRVASKIQRDAETDEWRRRFLDDFGDPDVIDEVC